MRLIRLGGYRRCAAESGIVEDLEILAHGTAGSLGRQSLFARNRSLPVDIGADEARIDRKTLRADQPLGHASLNGHLEQFAQQVAVAEAAVPVLGEGRVIGHRAIKIEAAEPAIGKV